VLSIGHPFTILAVILVIGLFAWLLSWHQHNVAIVDLFWPLFFLVAALLAFLASPERGMVAWIALLLTTLWATRLFLHLLFRNWGKQEDRRYAEIRTRFNPGFEWKSIFVIFWFQGFIAWVVSSPIYMVARSDEGISVFHLFPITLWLVGLIFETISDQQLVTFQRRAEHSNKVLMTGLWRYTRHPNYFGEFCIGWSFYLLSFMSGAWWTIYAPILMTYLLLRFSGITRMEDGIEKRRPGYKKYSDRTSAFFPWPPSHQ